MEYYAIVNLCDAILSRRESKLSGFCFKIEATNKTMCYKYGLCGEKLSRYHDNILVFRDENISRGKEWYSQFENAFALAYTKYNNPSAHIENKTPIQSPKIVAEPNVNPNSSEPVTIKEASSSSDIEDIADVDSLLDKKSTSHYVLAQNTLKEFFDATEEGKSIIWDLLKQLRPGMDLGRISFPSHILEPRSFLVKTTDYFAHIQYFKPISEEPDPGLRMLGLVKWLLSGFYLMPTGIKKPYNPILNETFRTMWKHEDGSRSYLVGEQVSHRPTISAFYATNRQQGWMGNGYIDFTTKFNGLSASIILGGKIDIYLLNFNEHYTMTFPEALASGFFVGPMLMEIAGKSVFECKESGYKAEVIFNVKGTFSSDKYQTVDAKITKNGEEVYKIWGNYYKELFYCGKDKVKKSLLKIDDIKGKSVPRYTIDMNQQGEWESDKLWKKVTDAIYKGDQITATEEKCKNEEKQRNMESEYLSTGTVHIPKYFVRDSFLGWKYVDFNNSKFNPDKELGDYEDKYHIKTLLKEQNECIDDGKQVKEELLTSSIETNNSPIITNKESNQLIELKNELETLRNQLQYSIDSIQSSTSQYIHKQIEPLQRRLLIVILMNVALIGMLIYLLLH
ncbi:hypothetical protein ENUP19_0163G0036 [Entamoeba nuttalli]|uniref:Oxysterol binding protein n=1 Tax=Entamoeba nuttalli TaxID=412467 RepID=A0ABQ0DM43_9EUKA